MTTLAYLLAITVCVAGVSAHIAITRRRMQGNPSLTGLPTVLLGVGAVSLIVWVLVLIQLR